MRTGRPPSDPDKQKATGYPGRRKSKVERRREHQEHLAELLAASPVASDDRLAPPAFIALPECAAALSVWRDVAPRLARLNLLHELDRYTFAMFCVHVAEYAAALEALCKSDRYRRVKTVSGDYIDRKHPAAKDMEDARAAVFDMSKRFGLSPLDRIEILAKQRSAVANGFGAPSDQASLPIDVDTAPTEDNPVGLLAQFDSVPPARPN